jgi:uncharacterized protein GlcG (DUF336 family)
MSALLPIATAKADLRKTPCLLHPLKADAYGANRHVCFGPIADISTNTGTFDAAPAQGAPIFYQAEGLALFRDRAIVVNFIFIGYTVRSGLGVCGEAAINEKKGLRQCRLTEERIMLKHICATTLTLGFLVSSADAQLVTRKDLTADLAVTMAQTAISACKAQGYNVSATIVGRAGEVIVQIRGDGAGMHTFENSFRKAWTARSFRAPSGTIEQRLKDNPNLPLIHLTNVIADKGGLPIKVGDDTIGGVGVSGCPGCDEPCSQAGIDKVADQLK